MRVQRTVVALLVLTGVLVMLGCKKKENETKSAISYSAAEPSNSNQSTVVAVNASEGGAKNLVVAEQKEGVSYIPPIDSQQLEPDAKADESSTTTEDSKPTSTSAPEIKPPLSSSIESTGPTSGAASETVPSAPPVEPSTTNGETAPSSSSVGAATAETSSSSAATASSSTNGASTAADSATSHTPTTTPEGNAESVPVKVQNEPGPPASN